MPLLSVTVLACHLDLTTFKTSRSVESPRPSTMDRDCRSITWSRSSKALNWLLKWLLRLRRDCGPISSEWDALFDAFVVVGNCSGFLSFRSDRIRDSQKRRIIQAINDVQQRLEIDSLIKRLENVELATEAQERLQAFLEWARNLAYRTYCRWPYLFPRSDRIQDSQKLQITQALSDVLIESLIKKLRNAGLVAEAQAELRSLLE